HDVRSASLVAARDATSMLCASRVRLPLRRLVFSLASPRSRTNAAMKPLAHEDAVCRYTVVYVAPCYPKAVRWTRTPSGASSIPTIAHTARAGNHECLTQGRGQTSE